MKTQKTAMEALTYLKKKAEQYCKYEELPTKSSSLNSFVYLCGTSLRFILSEKENILFAFLSLAVIGAGYFLGIQILDWIPQGVWENLKEDDDNIVLNIILLIWSFICVGLISYPLGIFTASMGASYVLRSQGCPSTIAECLKIVMPKSWTLWVFSWLDGWWTFLRILERLPKKNDRTPLSVKLRREAVFQAWKIASLGFLPALICGRNLNDCCLDSLSLLKDKFVILAKLRTAYSLICWISAIAAYMGMIALVFYIPFGKSELFSFYFIAGLPIVSALFLIMIMFRPLYIIASCRIYISYAMEKGIQINLPPTSSKAFSSLVAFMALFFVMAIVFLYKDELGITALLENPYLTSLPN